MNTTPNDAPERIYIQPQYVDGAVFSGGIYHLNTPQSASIRVETYIREDLASCTPEERTVIQAAVEMFIAEGRADNGSNTITRTAALIETQKAMKKCREAVTALMIARAKTARIEAANEG